MTHQLTHTDVSFELQKIASREGSDLSNLSPAEYKQAFDKLASLMSEPGYFEEQAALEKQAHNMNALADVVAARVLQKIAEASEMDEAAEDLSEAAESIEEAAQKVAMQYLHHTGQLKMAAPNVPTAVQNRIMNSLGEHGSSVNSNQAARAFWNDPTTMARTAPTAMQRMGDSIKSHASSGYNKVKDLGAEGLDKAKDLGGNSLEWLKANPGKAGLGALGAAGLVGAGAYGAHRLSNRGEEEIQKEANLRALNYLNQTGQLTRQDKVAAIEHLASEMILSNGYRIL